MTVRRNIVSQHKHVTDYVGVGALAIKPVGANTTLVILEASATLIRPITAACRLPQVQYTDRVCMLSTPLSVCRRLFNKDE